MSKKKQSYLSGTEDYFKQLYLYQYYYDRLYEIAVAMYDWKNMPKNIDMIQIERIVFNTGHALFFKDEYAEQFLMTRCTLGGELDMNDIPINRHAYALNAYSNELDKWDSVILYHDAIRSIPFYTVDLFAQRLSNLQCVVDVNINAQKTPVLLRCKEEQRLSVANAYRQFEGNVPVICATDEFNPDAISVLQTPAPFIADKVYEIAVNLWNDCLSFLGIPNIFVQKKERMVKDEVHHSMGGAMAARSGKLLQRRRFCVQINEMFGLDVDVDFSEDLQDMTEFPGKRESDLVE